MSTHSRPARPPCQACDRPIRGKVFRFSNVPESAFCSMTCQISRTRITATECTHAPVGVPQPPHPAFAGPVATPNGADCTCGVFYGNQTLVPKRHSFASHCPRCGGVTVD
jgi:hypothetical protein